MLWLFNTLGLVAGIAMLAAATLAVALCVRATRRTSTARSRRAAVAGAFGPLAVGLAAAAFGVIVWQGNAQAVATADAFQALGKAALAGFVVTAVPLAWATMVARRCRAVA